jgi:energy-coupling factor transport system substrate-specific component
MAPRLLQRRFALAAFCFVLGLAFSAFMDVWNWIAFYDEHTWQTFVAVHARGLPFDLAHAIGNVVIALAAGPELRRLLDRYGRRLHTEVVWA